MATFTITQETPNKTRLYLYPDGDNAGAGQLKSTDATYRYTEVNDDKDDIDYNTYVYNDLDTYLGSSFAMENHIIGTGTINYVKVYNVVRSSLPPVYSEVFYQIRIYPTGDTAVHYSSDYVNLTNAWAKKSYIWNENPNTDTAWSWTDINTLFTGISCKSAQSAEIIYTTLRPNGAGDFTQLDAVGGSPNWENVNEETPVTSEYNRCLGVTTEKDWYTVESHTFDGDILDVTVYAYMDEQNAAVTAKLQLDYNGTTWTSTYFALDRSSWRLYSKTNDTESWTQSDIDDLQVGVRMEGFASNSDGRVAQVYVVVKSYASEIPQIQVSDVYMEVGYSPASTECTLNKPQEISTNHSRNVKMLNFWNGEREVYDFNRSGKSMVLKGMEFQNDTCDSSCPCENIECIKSIARNGAVITISGLNPKTFNGNYRINSLGWEKISEKPTAFKWIIQLEDAEL